MRESLASFCQRNDRADLLREWDSERNLPLTPETVSYGSKKKVWWTCAQGHHWQAAVHTRTAAAQAVHTAADAFPSPEKTTSPQNIHYSPRNGTQRKTATSPRVTCSPAAIASSGGAAHMAISGAHR